MHRVDLKNRARPREGKIDYHWFENEYVGLKRTRFHRLIVPFESIDTGCDYIEQPENPELTIEWIELDIVKPSLLAGVSLCSAFHEGMEASIYIGSAHNPVTIIILDLKEIDRDKYEIDASIEIDFEFEGVAENESFNFRCTAIYMGEA